MTVRIKCRDHFFDLSEDMIILANKGRMVRVNCPVCNRSVMIKWQSVADLLGMTVEEAKEYLKAKLDSTGGGQVGTAPTMKRTPIGDDYEDDETYDDELEETFSNPVPSTKSKVKEDEIEEFKRAIESAAKGMRSMSDEEIRQDRTRGEMDTDEPSIRKTYLEEQAERTSTDILLDVIKTADLPGVAKTELSEFFSYRPARADGMPNDWQPKEVKDALVAYGINTTTADKVANRYQFLLSNWLNVKGRVNQMMGLLGTPASSMPGVPGSNQMPGGYGNNAGTAPNAPQMPGMPGIGLPQQQEVMVQNMITSYNFNPQAFFNWLSANPQYSSLWQIAYQRIQMQQMQNPYGMPSPMMMGGMGGMYPQMMGGVRSQRPSVSKEDVKRMVSDELDKLKEAIKNISDSHRGSDTSNALLTIMTEMMRSRDAEISALRNQPRDASKDVTHEMLSALLQHTLDSSRGDPATQSVLEELKELKKSMSEGGGSRNSSLEDFQKMLEGMKLRHSIDMEWEKFRHEKESSERTKDLIKKGIDEVVPVLANVAMMMGQKGASPAQMQPVQGYASENTISLPCPDCNTVITFPKTATTVTCPRCGAVHDVRQKPQPAPEPQPKSASATANLSVGEDNYNSDDSTYQDTHNQPYDVNAGSVI